MEPQQPRPATSGAKAAQRGSTSGATEVELDHAGLLRLRGQLEQRLQQEALRVSTARSYLRVWDLLIECARQRRGRRSLDAWREECVTAADLGRLGPRRDLGAALGAVVNRARALAAKR